MEMKYDYLLNKTDYDIKKTGDARWIDQKCTYDVISIIADCILEYVDSFGDDNKKFSVSDIWHSNYSRNNVVDIFTKPDPELNAKNEYDKYFGQPIKLLSYSKVLNVEKLGNKYYYSINDRKILENIALKSFNALNFLYEYITKVLKDSDIYKYFDSFFKKQTKESYKDLRDKFIDFTKKYTKINKETECGRIFTKILNPLSYKLKKKGTKKGIISNDLITLNDLQYNRINWRDASSGKSKIITRKEHEKMVSENRNNALKKYDINKAKKMIKKYNDLFYGGIPEVYQKEEVIKSIQVHHIFSKSDNPEISDCLENLIVLTPNQHFGIAHPNNNTQYIDKNFQYICLISKSIKIMENLTSKTQEKIYDFNTYKHVLNVGLRTKDFDNIDYFNFCEIIYKIDCFYDKLIKDQGYSSLI